MNGSPLEHSERPLLQLAPARSQRLHGAGDPLDGSTTGALTLTLRGLGIPRSRVVFKFDGGNASEVVSRAMRRLEDKLERNKWGLD